MKKILIVAIFICLASSQLVRVCPTDGSLVKCSLEDAPVCGIKVKAGTQIKETFTNHCIACSLGKSSFTVEGRCESFPKSAQFCSPLSKALLCTQIFDPVCGWFNQSINCLVYPCAVNAGNNCLACKDSNVLYTTKGQCPQH